MGNLLDNRQSRQRSTLPFLTGTADSTTDTIISAIDVELAKLFEDRNILLTQGGLITYLGTQVQFSESLKIELNSKIAGGAPIVIDLGAATRTVSASGKMIYAVIDRTLGTAVVTDDASSLPNVSSANQEVFLIAKRQDSGDGLKRLYFRNGTALNEGQSVRLGSSGTGSGDTGDLLERIKDRLTESPFEWAEPNLFATDGDDKISSATASYYLVNSTYQFTAAGQNIVSMQSLDPEFLTEQKDVDSVELLAFWKQGSIDSNAVYEVSRNGGIDWQTVTMQRAGSTTDSFRGILRFPQDSSYISLHEWAVANATAYRELNSTTLQSVGQKFSVSSSVEEVVQRSIVYINKMGSPVGQTLVRLVRDDGTGKPSTNLLDVITETQVSNAGLSSGDNAITVYIGANSLPTGTYHFVLATDSAYRMGFSAGVNSVRARVDAAAPIGTFDLTEFNGTIWATNAAQTLVHRLEGRPLDLRVRVTSSTSSVEMKGYAVLYGRETQVVSGLKNRQVISFDGTVDNTNEFILSNFLPDPDLLRIYHAETGQVYVKGSRSFYLDGHKVIFPVNTFNGLGTVTLVFDQPDGVSFDNSEINGAILSANFLGSTDALIDRSQPGRGIMLRSPNGSLYEITIQNGGTGFDIYLVT